MPEYLDLPITLKVQSIFTICSSRRMSTLEVTFRTVGPAHKRCRVNLQMYGMLLKLSCCGVSLAYRIKYDIPGM